MKTQLELCAYVDRSIALLQENAPNIIIGPIMVDYRAGNCDIFYRSNQEATRKYVRRCSLNPGIPTTEASLAEGAILYENLEANTIDSLRHIKKT